MIQITNPADCCGCTACASICKQDAISMKPDALGFLYPEVDLKKCVDCGMCDDVCAFNDKYDVSLNFDEPLAYGARHKNVEEVMKSQSGAAFIAISDYILEQQGVVYGVGFGEHFKVVHKSAITKSERDEFRGSKYVQSDLTGVFRQVKNHLIEGKIVLFVGTACQTAGLHSYVGSKLRENLILVDIICRGVPGPFLWRDYVNYLETQNGKRLKKANFRDKIRYGWSGYNDSYTFDDGTTKYPETRFYRGMMFRHSCPNCHFCNIKRPSDITLGDFWGWEKQNPAINLDDKGVSLVLVNTEKGQKVWDKAKKDLDSFVAVPESYLQPNLLHPTAMHPKRMQFEKDYVNKGFEYVFNHDYNLPPLWKRILNKVSGVVNERIR